MSQIISETVKVGIVSDLPKWVFWNGRKYIISSIGLHRTLREGKTLYHIFSVSTSSLFMKLILNTDNLSWKLEEVSCGL